MLRHDVDTQKFDWFQAQVVESCKGALDIPENTERLELSTTFAS